MKPGSTMRTVAAVCGGARRLAPLAAALAALLVFPTGNVAHTQAPPDEIVLVNAADGPVEHKRGWPVRCETQLRTPVEDQCSRGALLGDRGQARLPPSLQPGREDWVAARPVAFGVRTGVRRDGRGRSGLGLTANGTGGINRPALLPFRLHQPAGLATVP